MSSTALPEAPKATGAEQFARSTEVAPPAAGAEPRDSWLALSAIVVLGGISGIAYYMGFVDPYQLRQYYQTPLLDLAKISGHTPISANEWGFTWIVVFACYYFAFRLCPTGENVTRAFRRTALFLICGWAAFFSINLIFMYPVGAADLFDQIFRARLLSHYGLNPFTTLPTSLAGDPFQAYVAWKGDPSPYGPAWETLAGGVSWLAGNSLWNNLILFKILVCLAYGISVALTYGILRVLRPDWALRGTLFFAWNPLVLFEVAGNGHNDAVVVMFILAAVYLFALAYRWAVIPALMAGALTKFVPVLLIPIAAAALWKDRLRNRARNKATENPERRSLLSDFDALKVLAAGGVVALGLAIAFYAPFWSGVSTIGALGRSALFTASIPKVVLDTLVRDFGIPGDDAQFVVRNTALALISLVAIGLGIRILFLPKATTAQARNSLLHSTFGAFYELIFVYLAFATLWFQPWYLMWLVALTAPVALLVNANRTILFCIGGIANYFVWDYLWLWNHADIRTIQVTSAVVIYTLPLLYTLLIWFDSFRRRAGPAAAT